MPSEDETDAMDWETVQRIYKIGMVISFLVAALGIVGEFLGWWNDTGEVLATVGSLAGIVLGVISLLANASQSQVAGVADGVDRANETLVEIDEDLGKLDRLDDIDAGIDRQTDLLTQIRDLL